MLSLYYQELMGKNKEHEGTNVKILIEDTKILRYEDFN